MKKRELGPKTFLFPMPAALVGANIEGKPNYLVIAFAGIVNAQPPTIFVSINHAHYTNIGIMENRTFSVNIPSADMVKVTDYCGIVTGGEVDKSMLFDSFYGKLGTAPMISECPVNLECRLVDTIEYEVDTAYIGEVTEVYVNEDCFTNEKIDILKMNPLLFSTSEKKYFRVGEYVGNAWNIGIDYRAKDVIKKKRG